MNSWYKTKIKKKLKHTRFLSWFPSVSVNVLGGVEGEQCCVWHAEERGVSEHLVGARQWPAQACWEGRAFPQPLRLRAACCRQPGCDLAPAHVLLTWPPRERERGGGRRAGRLQLCELTKKGKQGSLLHSRATRGRAECTQKVCPFV